MGDDTVAGRKHTEVRNRNRLAAFLTRRLVAAYIRLYRAALIRGLLIGVMTRKLIL